VTEKENTGVKVSLRLVHGDETLPDQLHVVNGSRRSGFAVNLIEPGKASWFREHVHEMTPQVLQRNYVEYENKLRSFERGNLPLTESDRMEICEILAVLSARLDEVLPKMAADITDHDRLSGNRTTENWPEHLPHQTKLIHFHFCELAHAWNLNPFRRDASPVSVDESAEAEGRSRLAFCSKVARNDFLDYYSLDDFVLFEREDEHFFYIELTNKFDPREAQVFLNIYRSAMNALAVIHDERTRAIRNDGGKVGFIAVDHFAARETHELMRIKQARIELGAGQIGKV
jgi:hypothetical protein